MHYTTSVQIIVDSLIVSYMIFGSGERTILLLHGWGDTQASFAPLARALAKDYRAVTLDLPGFGGSQAPGEVWNLERYARFIGRFLQKLNGSTRVTALIGHSNGGAIAIAGLAAGSFTADKLILLASAGVRATTGQGLHRLAWTTVAKIGKTGARYLPQAVRQRLRRELYRAAGSDLLIAPHLEETFKKVVSTDVRGIATKVQIPSLLLYGSADIATPPSYGRLLAAVLPKSELKLLPGAGHFVHIDRPADVERYITDFLR